MTLATSILVRMPLAARCKPGRKTVVAPMVDAVAPVMTRADPRRGKAPPRAFRYQRMLDKGRCASITEMATEEKLEWGYLGTLLRLALLAPALVEAILDGHAPEGLGLPRLLEPCPIGGADQHSGFQRDARPEPGKIESETAIFATE